MSPLRPADGLSRRLVLAGVASAAALPEVLATVPAVSAMEAIDPVFGLIEAHRDTHVDHMAAIDPDEGLIP